MVTEEMWRPIPGWDGYYSASTHGRIRSEARNVPGRPGVAIVLRAKVLRGYPSPEGRGGRTCRTCRRDRKRNARTGAR